LGSQVLTRTNKARASARAIAMAAAGMTAVSVALAGCSGQIVKHGHQFRESELHAVQPGMSQEQVRTSLGSPATTASIPGGNAYYYISSTSTKTAFLPEKEVDRKVVAVYFNPLGTVDKVANYTLKDGKVFDTISRTTPAPGGRDDGIIKQLFRNLGQKQLFGDS
jgi:outer membrane protein assembly factor BamE (lipoprotein component of BamABCDE complex)